MNCPVDGTPLAITDRQGIEVDFCPRCRGVWLDRGELDKLIDRTTGMGYPQGWEREHRGYEHHDRDWDDDDHERHEHRGHYPRRRKREGFLGELFDFD